MISDNDKDSSGRPNNKCTQSKCLILIGYKQTSKQLGQGTSHICKYVLQYKSTKYRPKLSIIYIIGSTWYVVGQKLREKLGYKVLKTGQIWYLEIDRNVHAAAQENKTFVRKKKW